ncbi:MAG: hypothetical protein HY720_12300 [Planctomycetes bacterium]|nr:hypothetical protein [Planctomycetota bacterium]
MDRRMTRALPSTLSLALLLAFGPRASAVDIEFSEAPPRVVGKLEEGRAVPGAEEEPGLPFDLSLDYHTRLSYYDLHGNPSRAIKRQGWNYVQDLTLRIDHEVYDRLFLVGEGLFRHIEDPRLQSRAKRRQLNENRLRFERGFLALERPDVFRAEAGDTLVNYNRFVLSRNLTVYPGAEAFLPVGDGRLRFAGLFGEEPEEQIGPIDRRQVAGGRVAMEKVAPFLDTLGATIAWSNDKDPDREAALAEDGTVYGTDGEVSTPFDTVFYWDFAGSRVERESFTGGPSPLLREFAWRTGARYSGPLGVNANLEYEEVQDGFRTVLGSAAPDTRSYRASVNVPLPEKVDWTFLYQFTQNNVDDKDRDTFFVQNFSSDARYRPLEGNANEALDSLAFTAGYGIALRNSEKEVVRNQTDTYRTGFSIAKVWGFDFRANYQRLEDRDHVTAATRHGNRTSGRAGYTWEFEKPELSVNPYHEFRYQDTSVGVRGRDGDVGRVREYIWGCDSRFLADYSAAWSYSLRFDDAIGGGNSGKEDRYRANFAYTPDIPWGDLRVGLDMSYNDVDADLDRFDFRDFEMGLTIDYHF